MARAEKNNYFDMLSKLAGFNKRAAELLAGYLANFDPAKISEMRAEMHAVEHAADDAKHALLGKLAREFVTPIERDDIMRLASIIDDVTDAIDETVLSMYIYNITRLPEALPKLGALVVKCTEAFEETVTELKNFKKSKDLKRLIIEVNKLESEADTVHIEALHSLFTTPNASPMSVIGYKTMLDCLESCCDLCEDGAEIIEGVVMNNM